eukprot:TCALIF_11952-PA protein Name:"Protein of unknown function" AED:0.89 eAED:1.00 QI:0/0/0/0.33/1/1/3/0/546
MLAEVEECMAHINFVNGWPNPRLAVNHFKCNKHGTPATQSCLGQDQSVVPFLPFPNSQTKETKSISPFSGRTEFQTMHYSHGSVRKNVRFERSASSHRVRTKEHHPPTSPTSPTSTNPTLTKASSNERLPNDTASNGVDPLTTTNVKTDLHLAQRPIESTPESKLEKSEKPEEDSEEAISSMVTQLGGIREPLDGSIVPKLRSVSLQSHSPATRKDSSSSGYSGGAEETIDYLKWVSETKKAPPRPSSKSPNAPVAPHRGSTSALSQESGLSPDLRTTPEASSSSREGSSARNSSPDSGYDQPTPNILIYKTEPKVRRVTPGSSRDNINHITPPKVKPKPAKDLPFRRLPITESEAMDLTPKTSLHEPIRSRLPKVNYENYNQLNHPEPDYMNLEALRIKPQELDQFSKSIGFASTQRIMQMYANPRAPWMQMPRTPTSFSPCHGAQSSKTMSHADLRTIRQGQTQRSSSTWDIRHAPASTHNYQNHPYPLYSNVFQDYAEPVMNHPMNTRPTYYHTHHHYHQTAPPPHHPHHHRSQYLQSNDTLY